MIGYLTERKLSENDKKKLEFIEIIRDASSLLVLSCPSITPTATRTQTDKTCVVTIVLIGS
jgi:hypothetical protein